ncbi:MAG: hypothetical protein J5605_02240 [Bacteroidales bacterium]|nr:hypothetical protein [Bacteroidales bacterium]
MKKTFKFEGETLPFEADKETLQHKLSEIKQLINNYQEVVCDLDSDAYMARGNGFCETKYSESFLDNRIEALTHKALQIEQWIREF